MRPHAYLRRCSKSLRHLLSISTLETSQIEELFSLCTLMKEGEYKKEVLKGKTVALIFQKPSMRTRVSFQVAVTQLGGSCVYLGPEDIGFGTRESVQDIGKVLSGYVDCIVARTFSHKDLMELAKFSSVPVINGLTDLLHPCQVLSDLFTIKEKKGALIGQKIVFVGDGANNVSHSLLFGASKMGVDITVCCPKDYAPNKKILLYAQQTAKHTGANIEVLHSPTEAVIDADIIYTDVWTSMGQESEAQIRRKVFAPFQVNRELLSMAKEDCLLMHCLPARRGEEITDDVIESPNSIIFEQAKNRLYMHKAIIAQIFEG
jgi:ornithine carbamoyltransferase